MQDERKAPLRLVLGGDVMLGRNVKERILRFGPDYPLGPVARLMAAADLAIVNLECALSSSPELWPGAPKAFYFGAPPQAVETLVRAGVGMVSLANNHVLDYGVAGLRQTLRLLQRHRISHAGAGESKPEARAAACVERSGMRFGMAAFCDHQADFAAEGTQPGIAYLDLADEPRALAAFRAALAPLLQAGVAWPILSLHWGPNMVLRPSPRFRRLAHAAIEMGWKILFGHSAHVFHGIELYRGCPIIYAAGDLVDDYRVDPELRNDRQLLIELVLVQDRLAGIELHPLEIGDCQVSPAGAVAAAAIADRLRLLCGELGTRVDMREGRPCIVPAPA